MTSLPEQELPCGWIETALSELFSKIVDGSHNPPKPKEHGVAMLSARNIVNDRIEFSDFRWISPEDFEIENRRTEIRNGDVLLTIVGTIGRSAVVHSHPPFTLQRSVAVLRPAQLNPRFCMYQFQSPTFQNRLRDAARGTAQKGVYLKLLSQLRFSLTSPQEQDRIVAEIEKQFTRLDAAVAALKRVQANLKRYRAAVLKAACEGRLVPTEAELACKEGRSYETGEQLLARILKERRAKWEADQLAKMVAAGKPPKNDDWKKRYREPSQPDTTKLPKLPGGWIWASVEMLSTKVVDGVHKKPDYVDHGIPFVTVRNLTAGPGIDFERLNHVTESDHAEFIQRANPEYGDILVSKDGTLGVIRTVRTNRIFSIFVSVAMIKPVIREMSDYLEIALSSPQVQVQMVPKGSGLQHIHLEDLRQDCVPLPPLQEQTRIVQETLRQLSNNDALDVTLNLDLTRAVRLRQSFLKHAFEGKLVPQDPNDEPATALLERIRAERAEREDRPAPRSRARTMTSVARVK